MKKRVIICMVAALIEVLYLLLSPVLLWQSGAVFWTGLFFFTGATALTAGIACTAGGLHSPAFSIEAARITVSLLYGIIVVAVNVVCGRVFPIGPLFFLLLHGACAILAIIILLLLFYAGKKIEVQQESVTAKQYELRTLRYEFEKVKGKLKELPQPARREALRQLDGVLDALLFAAQSKTADFMDIDSRLRVKAFALSDEVDNLIQIQSEEIGSLTFQIKEIRRLIDERNLQAELL